MPSTSESKALSAKGAGLTVRTELVSLTLALLLLAGCNLQKTMLYYPDASLPSPDQLAAYNLRFWPSPDPASYRGFIGASGEKAVNGTIIVFHGNAGTAAHRSYYEAALAPLGFRVILAEYPGYGRRPGEPGEETFVQDGRETVRLASAQYGGPIFLLGESLGCGVAASIAAAPPVAINGLILITPWDTLLSVAKEKFSWLPVRLFLSDAYDSVSNLKRFPGRIAVAGAEQDQVIPFRHARALYESLPGPKRIWTISGAGHNDWIDRVDRSWWREITSYVAGKGP